MRRSVEQQLIDSRLEQITAGEQEITEHAAYLGKNPVTDDEAMKDNARIEQVAQVLSYRMAKASELGATDEEIQAAIEKGRQS